jgi:hypothetical protein
MNHLRSIAALTVSRHIELIEDGINLLLYSADAESGRSESIRFPEALASSSSHTPPSPALPLSFGDPQPSALRLRSR